MLGFFIIGAIGLGLLLLSLLFGEVLEAFDLDIAGGFLSGPVVGSFLAAFGFGGGLTLAGTDVGLLGASLAGLASGALVGGVAGLFTRSLMKMPTDPSLRTSDLVGTEGTVITPIPAEGFGEVSLSFLGQPLKYNARADRALPSGTVITVTAVLSNSAVRVQAVDTR